MEIDDEPTRHSLRLAAAVGTAVSGALKIGLLIMASLSLLAIFPATRLPNCRPGEIPSNPPQPKPQPLRDDE